MRSLSGPVVGGIVAVVGAVVWSVSLAIYQPVMEPSGFFVHDGTPYPVPAENNTYWPRETRHLGLLLALAGLVAIGRAARRAFLAAAGLGVVWLAADLVLDRIDISGRPAAGWLAVAACAAVATTAVVSRGGTPLRWGPHLAAGTAALLAGAAAAVTTPWQEPITQADQVAIDNAVTVIDIILAAGFLAVAVAMLAPAMTTPRSRWLVPLGAAVTLATTVLIVADGESYGFAIVAVAALATMMVAAAEDVPLSRLLVAGGVSALAVISIGVVAILFVGIPLGRAMTALAGNPAVHAADTDLSLALSVALLGLALAAVSRAVIRWPAPAPNPSEA